MSRGGNMVGARGEQFADLTFFAGLTGNYDQGLFLPDETSGRVDAEDQYGAGVSWGAYGGHAWRRSSVGVDYRGDYRWYSRDIGLNGTNQALGIEFQHAPNRTWQFVARQAAGTTIQPFGGFTTPSYVDFDNITAPNNEIYNSRYLYLQTTGYAGYRISARTQLTMGGGFFRTDRRNEALINSNGYNATAQITRRLNRDTYIGGTYDFTYYSFPRAFGDSNIHSLSAGITRSIGRRSEFTIYAGVSRVETLGSEQYQLAPEIAAILGVSTGIRVFHRLNYFSTVNATFVHRRKRTSYNAGYSRGVTPGNGVYLTSLSEALGGGVSFAGTERVSFGLNGSYTRMNSVWNTVEPYDSLQGGGGLTYRLGRGLNFTANVAYRKMDAGTEIDDRRGVVASAGLYWSSSELPLSIW
jgi:hypothetical protein